MKKTLVLLFICVFHITLWAQNDTIRYDAQIVSLTSNGDYAPFWLQSNQFGKIPFAKNSNSAIASIYENYHRPRQKFDYGFKTTLVFQSTTDKNLKAYIHEFYAKGRYSIFEMTVGAKEEHLGCQDSTLSSGGFLFSNNARPMPKVTFATERFIPVPFTKGFMEFKAGISHGWFTDNISINNAYLHHKYLHGSLGGKLPVHLFFGLDHVVEWAGGNQPATLKNFLKIFMGKSGDNDASRSDQINMLGNHIISQHLKLVTDISDFQIIGYWQNISEDTPIRPIWHTVNRPDGLWGVSVSNKRFPFIRKILYEYLNTTDQSGPFHDRDGIVYGGNDGYFRNGDYLSGWSYYSRTIGTPFITSPIYNTTKEYGTQNNHVQVHHFGAEGNIFGYEYRSLASFSKNYGLDQLHSIEWKNTSLLLEVKKTFPKLYNIQIGLSVASDFGKYYSNSTGCMLSLRKQGNLFHL